MQLNPRLAVTDLGLRYQERRRLVVSDVLVPHIADEILRCLSQQVQWGLAFQDESGPQVLNHQRFNAMTAAERAALEEAIDDRARRGFQFSYRCYPIVDAYLQRRDTELVLHPLFEFMNSPVMLDFIRAITGNHSIIRADAQATLFAPGDFLTLHNDFDPQKGRLVAYVLGFAKNWRAEYGGVLQFFDENHNPEQGFVPKFNSLMLFSVPQLHAVSSVSRFAPLGRYSITGWFQDATGVPSRTKARFGL